MIRLIAVISLLASVIWHSPASAGAAPALQSPGEIGAGQVVPSTRDVDGQGTIFVAAPLIKAVSKLDHCTGTARGSLLPDR